MVRLSLTRPTRILTRLSSMMELTGIILLWKRQRGDSTNHAQGYGKAVVIRFRSLMLTMPLTMPLTNCIGDHELDFTRVLSRRYVWIVTRQSELKQKSYYCDIQNTRQRLLFLADADGT
jgi:hypothetical protein